MKKIIICVLAALSVVTVLASCGSKHCSLCYEKCSGKSYKDGEYILCGECQKKLFKETVESAPEVFFADAAEVTAE